jgi:hypothetical protein
MFSPLGSIPFSARYAAGGMRCLLGFAGKIGTKVRACRWHANCRSPVGTSAPSSRQLVGEYSSRPNGGRDRLWRSTLTWSTGRSTRAARTIVGAVRGVCRALPRHLHEEERRPAHDRKGEHDHEVIEHRHSIRLADDLAGSQMWFVGFRPRTTLEIGVSGKRNHAAEHCRVQRT